MDIRIKTPVQNKDQNQNVEGGEGGDILVEVEVVMKKKRARKLVMVVVVEEEVGLLTILLVISLIKWLLILIMARRVMGMLPFSF